MKFKLDENFGHRAKELFKKHGYNVSTILDQKMCSSSDRQVFERCKAEDYCLVTLDKDFSNVLNYPPNTCSGIVVMRLPGKACLLDIDALIMTFILALEREKVEGKLWIVEIGRIREYQQGSS